MKAPLLSVSLSLIGLVVGCSREDDLSLPPPPVAVTQSLSVETSLVPVLPSDSATGRPIGQSSEESAADIGRTENVYQQWNDALAEYRQKHGRLPRNVQELEAFKPALGGFKPAPGFRLEIYPQFNSIEFAPVRTATSAAYRP
jgi:hypothetical protein